VETKTQDRQSIIGGSEIAALMGMSRWKTPLQLWAQKTGRFQEDPLGNFEAAEIGTELEEYVSRKFTKKTGIKLRRDSRTFRHSQYPYLVAHIDRWVVGEDAVFEAKTASAFKLKEWTDDKIPQEYVLQVQWYLGILKKKIGYIAVLIGGQKFIWNKIEFDKELFETMIQKAIDFKEHYIDADVMPIAMAGDNDFLDSIWPSSVPEKVIEWDGEKETRINMLIEERVGGLLAIRDARKELDDIEAKLKQEMGDNEMGKTNQFILTWKNQIRESADTRKLKDDGLFERYKKVSDFRVLRSRKTGELLDDKGTRQSNQNAN